MVSKTARQRSSSNRPFFRSTYQIRARVTSHSTIFTQADIRESKTDQEGMIRWFFPRSRLLDDRIRSRSSWKSRCAEENTIVQAYMFKAGKLGRVSFSVLPSFAGTFPRFFPPPLPPSPRHRDDLVARGLSIIKCLNWNAAETISRR